MGRIGQMLAHIEFPAFFRARQMFDGAALSADALAERVSGQLAGMKTLAALRPGWRVAITVGSRSIAGLDVVLRVVARELAARGAQPFFVAAMGMHGGSAEGRQKILADLGLTESALGFPVVAAEGTTVLGSTERGAPVHADKAAAGADAVVVVNRVKPHPGFSAPVESGLMKMLAVGLGKKPGCDYCHGGGFEEIHARIVEVAGILLGRMNVLLGVAVIENAHGGVYDCVLVEGAEIPVREPALLEEARALMPRPLLDDLDVMVVEEMGKNISGAGIDPSVTGRMPDGGRSASPQVERLVLLDLTPESGGNAHGVGMADFVSRRLFEKMDGESTYPDALANRLPRTDMIPPVMPDDRAAIAAALLTCGRSDTVRARAMMIRNTADLGEVLISAALLRDAEAHPGMKIAEGPFPLRFDENGVIQQPWRRD